MSDTTLNITGLEKIIKSLKAKPPVARVGILGSSSRHGKKGKSSGQTNAEIGAIHEFGSSRMPQRSFLRVPLIDNLQKYLQSQGAFDETTLKEVVRTGDITSWVKKMAIVAEKVVLDAFDTAGFGKWPGWKTPGYKNNTGQILIDTQQLRKSITWDIQE